MTITFPDDACAVTCTLKSHLCLTRQFKTKKMNKDICCEITSISGSSAFYRENNLNHDGCKLGLETYYTLKSVVKVE